MNILKFPICVIKGHDINPNETITPSMHDKRNWLCRCHRCGLYEMHDGATSGISITLTAKSAKRTAMDFETLAVSLQADRRAGEQE